MLQVLPFTDENIIATKVSHTLKAEDYEKLRPLVEKLSGQHKKIRLYFEMDDFDGWKPKAFWEDVKLGAKHAREFEKIAMVGDKQWEHLMTKFMEPFTSADVEYFDLDEKSDAKAWIRS